MREVYDRSQIDREIINHSNLLNGMLEPLVWLQTASEKHIAPAC
jgi:hypothetical protein